MTNPNVNPVGYLQEFVQKYHCAALPEYKQDGTDGPPHAREFTIKCLFNGMSTSAKCTTKKQAKTESAKKMVQQLVNEGFFDQYINNLCTDQSESITSPTPDEASNKSPSLNPISILQEYCQKRQIELPTYVENTKYTQGFEMECHVGNRMTSAISNTKKSAKAESAAKMCRELDLMSSPAEIGIHQPIQQPEEITMYQLNKDPVTKLKEFCDRHKLPVPFYRDDLFIKNMFNMTCTVGSVTCFGVGNSRKDAKKHAAHNVLEELESEICPSQNIQTKDEERKKKESERKEHTTTFQVLEEFDLGQNDPEGVELEMKVIGLSLDDVPQNSVFDKQTFNQLKNNPSRAIKIENLDCLENKLGLSEDIAKSGVRVDLKPDERTHQLKKNPSRTIKIENLVCEENQLDLSEDFAKNGVEVDMKPDEQTFNLLKKNPSRTIKIENLDCEENKLGLSEDFAKNGVEVEMKPDIKLLTALTLKGIKTEMIP